MAVWGDEETLKLIQLWGEDSIQAELEGCKRNAQVFSKIASELREVGYERTVLQCCEKIKKLRADYRKIRDSHNKTGAGRKKWKFFEAIDVVIGHKPATCPPLDSSAPVLDSDADQEVENASESGNVSDAETAPLAETVREKSQRSSTPLPPSTSGDRSTGDETSTSSASISSCTASTPSPPSKKRKLSKLDEVEGAVKGIVDSLMDDKIAKIEERRLDLEEKMAERDSKYETDMLEFQKQMFSTLAGMMQRSGQMPGPSGLGHQPPPFLLPQPNPASSAYIPSTTSIYNTDYYQGSESEEDQY